MGLLGESFSIPPVHFVIRPGLLLVIEVLVDVNQNLGILHRLKQILH